MRTYSAQRGETCRFLLHTPVDTDIAGWDVSCQMRRAEQLRRGAQGLDPDATLAVTAFAGDDDRGPGWYFTLSAAVSAALSAGRYKLDARVTLSNAEIVFSDTWALELLQPVTEPTA